MISLHWIPLHRGSFGPYNDKGVFATWKPPFVKIVWDGDKVPYLEDLPPECKIVWRNYPLSEQFLSGLNEGTKILHVPMGMPDLLAIGPDNLPQSGSGRDLYQIKNGRSAEKSGQLVNYDYAADTLPTPEQAAAAYVKNAEEIANYCETQGVARSRLLFEGPNEWPVWKYGYTGLAALELARLRGLHKLGLRGVYSNLGVGWPGNTGPDTPPVWAWANNLFSEFLPGDYLGGHEYWWQGGPEQNRGWWAARILKCTAHVPILITECGIDGGVMGAATARQGWFDLPGSQEQNALRYIDELYRYCGMLAADDRTDGVCVYTYDGNQNDWGRMGIRIETFVNKFLDRIKNTGLPKKGMHVAGLETLLMEAFGDKYVDLRNSLVTNGTYLSRSSSVIDTCVVHHTAVASSTTWQSVAVYHVRSKMWPGIAYHFGIDPSGQVNYLGDVLTMRYHAGAANGNSIGICFGGNFENDQPTPEALSAYHALVDVLNRYTGRKLRQIGHRDVPDSNTVCPGKNLYNALFAPATPVADPLPENEPDGTIGFLDEKERFWIEEYKRQHDAGHTTRAEAILTSLIKFAYRVEKQAKGG